MVEHKLFEEAINFAVERNPVVIESPGLTPRLISLMKAVMSRGLESTSIQLGTIYCSQDVFNTLKDELDVYASGIEEFFDANKEYRPNSCEVCGVDIRVVDNFNDYLSNTNYRANSVVLGVAKGDGTMSSQEHFLFGSVLGDTNAITRPLVSIKANQALSREDLLNFLIIGYDRNMICCDVDDTSRTVELIKFVTKQTGGMTDIYYNSKHTLPICDLNYHAVDDFEYYLDYYFDTLQGILPGKCSDIIIAVNLSQDINGYIPYNKVMLGAY